MSPTKHELAIVGDYITDVVFPIESRMPLWSAKETMTARGSQEHSIVAGPGGLIYLQEAIDILFDTHFPHSFQKDAQVAGATNTRRQQMRAAIVKHLPTLPEYPQSKYVNHWAVAKRPCSLASPTPTTYRAIEKSGALTVSQANSEPWPSLPDSRSCGESGPSLLVVADYNRWVRRSMLWSDPRHHKAWLTSESSDLPRRIILLGNRLPRRAFKINGEEPMWDELFQSPEALKATVVITSLDRLRQEGADISKRISWDDTIHQFVQELKNFPPLEVLSKVGHLVVRVGLVGAFHCFWENEEHKIQFIYNPTPKQEEFRNRKLQGNAFAIRPAIPACIAFHIFLRMHGVELDDYDRQQGPITTAIESGLSLIQNIYTSGFGETFEDVKAFIKDPEQRRVRLVNCFRRAYKSYWTGEDATNSNSEWVTDIIRPPKYPTGFGINVLSKDWGILAENFRAMVKPDELLSGADGRGGGFSVEEAFDALALLEELRRLRMARTIVMLGIDNALNREGTSEMIRREKHDTLVQYLDKMLKLEVDFDEEFRERVEGELNTEEIRTMLTANSIHAAFPLNGPISEFGELKVMGRTDTENHNSVRNLIRTHLAAPGSKTLSIAIFGPPGSGKSFAVKSIAKAVCGSALEVYECNISQLKERDDLNREFFNAFQILLRGRTPLILFDEFDCALDRRPLGWLKYFLEPMQDGRFRHAHGAGELKHAIFVFAGGTHPSYDIFKGFTAEPDVKLKDFISRLHGIIDVPGLSEDKTYSGCIPYIRRALILRAEIEKDSRLVDDNGIARIDRNVLDAFLKVDDYQHDARSMISVLGMCVRWNDRLEKISVPSKEQLNLHTNGTQFRSLMTEPKKHGPRSERFEKVLAEARKRAIP